MGGIWVATVSWQMYGLDGVNRFMVWIYVIQLSKLNFKRWMFIENIQYLITVTSLYNHDIQSSEAVWSNFLPPGS